MPKEPHSIYLCPDRLSDACATTYRACFNEIALQRELRLEDASDVVSDVMGSYERIKEHTKSWENQVAVKGLESVFEQIAKQKYDSVNTAQKVVCTGRTLLRQACTAVTVDISRYKT